MELPVYQVERRVTENTCDILNKGSIPTIYKKLIGIETRKTNSLPEKQARLWADDAQEKR